MSQSGSISEVVPNDTLTQGFDLTAIEQLDPSLADGYRVVYDREVPFELRVQENTSEPQQVGTIEAIKVKILLLGEEMHPESLKVELMSENDLFFHYFHICDPHTFETLQEQQKLMVEFSDYANVLIRMLNNCIKQPHGHLAVFVMQPDGHARLDFIQNMEYKFIELLSCNFNRSPEDIVQRTITYRYNSLKARLTMMQHRLQEVNNIVKVKNPSLLLQLQKVSATTPPITTSTKKA